MDWKATCTVMSELESGEDIEASNEIMVSKSGPVSIVFTLSDINSLHAMGSGILMAALPTLPPWCLLSLMSQSSLSLDAE